MRGARAVFRCASIVMALLVTAPAAARADDQERQACIDAYVDAQTAQKAGAFVRARESVDVCARESCPGMIKRDCVAWRDELSKLTPSVILRAEDDRGRALTDARAWVDGRSVALDGSAVPLDAGSHVVRFEHDGDAPQERTLVFAPREFDRRFTAVFPTKQPASKALPIASYVAGGLGIAALGVFGYASIRGVNDRASRQCDIGCNDSNFEHVHSEYLIADVALGIGLVSLGVGLAIWLMTDARDPPSRGAAPSFHGSSAARW